jgi:hypothetical protein
MSVMRNAGAELQKKREKIYNIILNDLLDDYETKDDKNAVP